MLTKDLLRFRNLSGYARPLFVDPSNRVHLEFASRLLAAFRNSIGEPRSDILESLQTLMNSGKDPKLNKGLLKLLDDRCEYSGNTSDDFPEGRKKLFRLSTEMLLNASETGLPEDFRTAVFRAAGKTVPESMYGNIYADLPDYEKLLSVPDFSSEDFLEKYNVVLAQSMVLYASDLEVVLQEPDGAKMRRCFKYLKFFRLLADVVKSSSWSGKKESSAPGEVHLKIDGPASILEGGGKYGLQLASFLPAVFGLEKWKISCGLRIGARELKFRLDDSSGLCPRFGKLGIYVPEEVRMFVSLFRKKYPEWNLCSDSPFLRGKGQKFIFPDMSFSRGIQSVHLELFHKWHLRQIPERLDTLAENPELPLIVGIDRSLISRNGEWKKRIEEHPFYKKKIFLFREFPETDRVAKMLDYFEPGLFSSFEKIRK